MPPVLVQSTKKVVTGVNNTTLAYGSNLTAGNLAVVAHTHYVNPDAAITTPTDTLGQTFLPAATEQVLTLGADACRLNSFYKENGAAGADTVTFDIAGGSTGDITCVVAEFSGIVALGALGANDVGAGTGTAVESGAVLATLGDLIWGAMTFAGNTTTIDETVGGTSGFALVQEDENGTSNMPISCEYKIDTAGGFASQWTLGASREFACHVAVFKAAVAGASARMAITQRMG